MKICVYVFGNQILKYVLLNIYTLLFCRSDAHGRERKLITKREYLTPVEDGTFRTRIQNWFNWRYSMMTSCWMNEFTLCVCPSSVFRFIHSFPCHLCGTVSVPRTNFHNKKLESKKSFTNFNQNLPIYFWTRIAHIREKIFFKTRWFWQQNCKLLCM